MKEDMEVDTLSVVDRHDAHPEVLVWIGYEERRGDSGYAHMHILSGRLAASQRRIMKSEIRIVDLDARAGVKGHIGGGGEVEALEFFRSAETIRVQDVRMRGIDERLEDLDIIAIVDRIGVDAV